MRLFVAIALPEEWKQVLAQPEASIGWLGRGVKWVEPRGMHLTLKFLGDVEEVRLAAIDARLATACGEGTPFSMRLRGTGVFPNAKRPRVYWAGLEAGSELMDLQTRIEHEMGELGFEREEHPFRPHLTLARIKDPLGKQRMTEALLLLERAVKPKTPEGAGPIHIRDTMHGKVTQMGESTHGIFGTPAVYGESLEMGTKAHFPPVDPLQHWVEKKLHITGKAARSVAFLIARAISRRGTKGVHMSEKGFAEQEAAIIRILEHIPEDIVKGMQK